MLVIALSSICLVVWDTLPVIENGEENKAASRRAELKIKVQVKVMN